MQDINSKLEGLTVNYLAVNFGYVTGEAHLRKTCFCISEIKRPMVAEKTFKRTKGSGLKQNLSRVNQNRNYLCYYLLYVQNDYKNAASGLCLRHTSHKAFIECLKTYTLNAISQFTAAYVSRLNHRTTQVCARHGYFCFLFFSFFSLYLKEKDKVPVEAKDNDKEREETMKNQCDSNLTLMCRVS